ncbi:hypothetical protein JB92DRAFT_3104763 [Gautieria morchelliformis]|nr:hypothetical protein JB92DRAFT_3104763 [Gautieria morchelliformis]
MLDGDIYDKLCEMAQTLNKQCYLPFGGLQLILMGDFFQFPPIPPKWHTAKCAFQGKNWSSTIQHKFILKHVYQADPGSPQCSKWWPIATHYKLPLPACHPHRLQGQHSAYMSVQNANQRRLKPLPHASFAYVSVDGGWVTGSEQCQTLLGSLMVPLQLELRVEAQVILIKNYAGLLFNRCIGIVTGFVLPDHHEGLSVGK